MERVAIFIDGSNLYKGLVQHLGSDYRLNFVEFITLLTAGRKLLRAYYYNAPLPPEDPAAKAHQSFLNYLKRVPYVTVRLGRLERRATSGAAGSAERRGGRGRIGAAEARSVRCARSA